MAILEKFTSYKKLFFDYVRLRFGIGKFMVFSILLVILASKPDMTGLQYAENFIFVFISLFVFRMLDDGFSFYIDRILHPERTYLETNHLKRFANLIILCIIIYQAGLFFYSEKIAMYILIFIVFSVILYLLFYKSKGIMLIIPLLKYPVFIVGMGGFSKQTEDYLFLAGVFFLMLIYDLLSKENRSKISFVFTSLLILAATCILQPWNGNIYVQVLLMASTFSVFLLPPKRQSNYIVLFFPLIHLVQQFLIP